MCYSEWSDGLRVNSVSTSCLCVCLFLWCPRLILQELLLPSPGPAPVSHASSHHRTPAHVVHVRTPSYSVSGFAGHSHTTFHSRVNVCVFE